MMPLRIPALPIALAALLAIPLLPAAANADDEDGVTTKSRIEVGDGGGDASVSTTVRSGDEEDDDDKTTVTKTTKKTITGEDVDEEDLEEDE